MITWINARVIFKIAGELMHGVSFSFYLKLSAVEDLPRIDRQIRLSNIKLPNYLPLPILDYGISTLN